MPRKVVLSFSLLSLVWGSTWLFIKLGLASWPPVLFAGTRLALGAALVFGYLVIRKIPLPKTFAQWWPALGYGVFEAAGFLLVFWGEFFIPSSRASVITALNPLMVVLLSTVFLRERVTLGSFGPALLGLVGVGLTALNVHSPGYVGTISQRYVGDGLLVLTAFFYALAGVWGKKFIHFDQDPMVTAFIQLVIGAFLLLLTASVWEPVHQAFHLTALGIFSLVYLAGLGSAFAFGLYFYCMKHMRAAELSLLTVSNPVVAIILGAAVAGESIGISLIFGMLVVISSIVWMNYPHIRSARRAAAEGVEPSTFDG